MVNFIVDKKHSILVQARNWAMLKVACLVLGKKDVSASGLINVALDYFFAHSGMVELFENNVTMYKSFLYFSTYKGSARNDVKKFIEFWEDNYADFSFDANKRYNEITMLDQRIK